MQKSIVALQWLTPLIAGVLVTLSLAPFFLWPLGIVGAFLMALVWRRQAPRTAAISGWLFGLGLFGSGVSWVYVSIHVHGYAPVPLAVFLTLIFVAGLALFTALQGWLLARLFRRDGFWLLLSFPAIWVLTEWLRGWIFTGFPWLYLGYAHLDTPLAGWAPVVGVYGLSYFAAFTAVAILVAADSRRAIQVTTVTAALLLWGAGFALQHKNWSQPNGEPLRVALVQGNIAQELKWLEREQLNIIRTYRELSRPYWGYDLVLWPETAVPMFQQQARPLLNALAQEAQAQGSTLITGIPSAIPRTSGDGYDLHNSILALGNGQGLYHKQKLVPFGEFVPLESVLRGLIDFFNLPMSSFTPGPENQPLLQAGATRAMPFICYEVVYPDFVAANARDSDVLITISNDSWFGASIGPHQHLQIAQMRALENARYMLRGTNNGISAIIDEKGQLTDVSGQFKQEVLTGEAVPHAGQTLFSKTGSVPILVIATVLGLLARDTRKRASKD